MTKTILKRKITILKYGTSYNVLIDGNLYAVYPDAFTTREIFNDVRNYIQNMERQNDQICNR